MYKLDLLFFLEKTIIRHQRFAPNNHEIGKQYRKNNRFYRGDIPLTLNYNSKTYCFMWSIQEIPPMIFFILTEKMYDFCDNDWQQVNQNTFQWTRTRSINNFFNMTSFSSISTVRSILIFKSKCFLRKVEYIFSQRCTINKSCILFFFQLYTETFVFLQWKICFFTFSVITMQFTNTNKTFACHI